MPDPRKPIEPLPQRWKPSSDPANIQVPGLDTTASVVDQIEQIEQLITIKLQNVDENFSKIHNVLGNSILPAVKKYSVGTEPVRDAAKFWTSFYEQAAQIRIPTFEDHSTVNEFTAETEDQQHAEQQSEEEPEDSIISSHESDLHNEPSGIEQSLAQTDASFTPDQAMSSTPATGRTHGEMDTFTSHGPEPSWATSMESPLLRLKGEIENFTANDSQFTPAPLSRQTSSSAYVEPTPEHSNTTILPVSTKGKGKAKAADPLLRGVLRHNLYANQSTDEFSTAASPVRPKSKPKTPVVPKTYNPYLPPDKTPGEWDGVVDLSDPSMRTPQRFRFEKRSASQHKLKTPARDDSDDSIDLAGMSPPVLMSPARPPRSSAELGLLKVGQSPVKQAAARIKQDLLRDVQVNSSRKFRKPHPVESSMSTVSTPPSLSRYHRAETSESAVDDSTLDNMLRRVGLAPSSGIASTPGLRLRSGVTNDDPVQAPYSTSSSPDSGDNMPSQNPLFTPGLINEDDDSLDDWDSDSFDDEVNPGIVSARPGAIQDDDAFDSDDSSDSLTDEVVGFVPPPGHPVDDYIEEESESFDYDDGEIQEETVFGVPPAQRLRAAAAQQQAQAGLRLHGGDLLDDTIGAQAIAGVRSTQETPTPASWGSNVPLK